MRDQERIIKVKELLDAVDNSQKVASKIVNSYFRSNKFIGSKDRKFISKSFWNILRNRWKIYINYLKVSQSVIMLYLEKKEIGLF